jgi:hypothetical protein
MTRTFDEKEKFADWLRHDKINPRKKGGGGTATGYSEGTIKNVWPN